MSLNAKVKLVFGKLQILIYCKYFKTVDAMQKLTSKLSSVTPKT